MYTKGIPKTELIVLIERMNGDMVTKIKLDELMETYGDMVNGEWVVKTNEKREELYMSYTE